jgi:dephospho-CoA kinase
VVVEPGKPAWEDIVAYFGKQVLHDDQTLDREKVREIVFRDLEEKKKLESFLHPRISEEFIKMVDEYTRQDPEAIIQAVVPLLIETNMQAFFHNILMVYATEDEQKRRLMARDGCTEEMAMNMIRSQLSVEEKKGYCDLIIDNSGTEKETHKQVKRLWTKLKKLRQDRKGSKV